MSESEEDEDKSFEINVKLPGEALDKEAANLLKAAMAESVQEIGGSLSNLWGGVVGDRLKIWRTTRLIEQLAGASRKIKELGYDYSDVEPLPNGFLFRALEGASKAEGDSIDELWQGLLAQSFLAKGNGARDTAFIASLEQLDPLDALALELFVQIEKDSTDFQSRYPIGGRPHGLYTGGDRYEEAREEFLLKIESCFESTRRILDRLEDDDIFMVAASRTPNLYRLGLVKLPPTPPMRFRVPQYPAPRLGHAESEAGELSFEILRDLASELDKREQLKQKLLPLFEQVDDGEFVNNLELTPFGVALLDACQIK